MKVSQSRDEEAWAAVFDQLWEMGISPDSGVEWLVCDGDVAIGSGVEIAYPGVKSQPCIWHPLNNIHEVLEKRYPNQKGRREESMAMVWESSPLLSTKRLAFWLDTFGLNSRRGYDIWIAPREGSHLRPPRSRAP